MGIPTRAGCFYMSATRVRCSESGDAGGAKLDPGFPTSGPGYYPLRLACSPEATPLGLRAEGETQEWRMWCQIVYGFVPESLPSVVAGASRVPLENLRG